MKIKLIISLSATLALVFSCSKTNFKETTVAINPVATTVQTVSQEMASTNDSKDGKVPPPSTSELPPGHPAINGQANGKAMPTPIIGKMKKATGGYTVEECFKNKKTLDGKTVSVRGKVVRFNSGIMNKNWLHLQDGTGAKGTNDIEVTTTDAAKVNDVIVVTGVIHYDKDIGAGYLFPGIIEDAKIKVE